MCTSARIRAEHGRRACRAAKRTRIIVIDHKQNGITDEAYVAYPSRIGKQRYLNVVQVEGNKTVGFIFVQYAVIDKNTLRFSTMNQEALKAAIASGRIKGETRGEGLGSETVITSESGDIAGVSWTLRRDVVHRPVRAEARPLKTR